jgi:hypothetical protein
MQGSFWWCGVRKWGRECGVFRVILYGVIGVLYVGFDVAGEF